MTSDFDMWLWTQGGLGEYDYLVAWPSLTLASHHFSLSKLMAIQHHLHYQTSGKPNIVQHKPAWHWKEPWPQTGSVLKNKIKMLHFSSFIIDLILTQTHTLTQNIFTSSTQMLVTFNKTSWTSRGALRGVDIWRCNIHVLANIITKPQPPSVSKTNSCHSLTAFNRTVFMPLTDICSKLSQAVAF